MNLIGLVLWVFMGYLAAITWLDWHGSAQVAVLVGCLTTSALQRLYTVTGRWKSQ